MPPHRLLIAASAVLAAALAQPAFAQAPAAVAASPSSPSPALAKPVVANGDLVDTLKLNGQFTTFVKALDATNLVGLLKQNKNLTVFAPTDAAFAAVPQDQLAGLMANKAALQKLLLHHIVNAPIPSSKIKGARGPVPSGAGDQILLDGSDEAGALKVDGATIVQADLQTDSGLLQVVDKVLTPGAASAAGAAAAAAAPTGQASPSSATVQTATLGTKAKP